MGFSVSGATAIIFVSLLFGFGLFYGSVSNGAEQVSDARDGAAESALEQQNTAVNLTTLAYDAGTDTLSVAVENEGTTALSVEDADVLLDNELQAHSTLKRLTVDGDDTTELWLPGETLEIEVRTNPQPDRVTIAVENGLAVSEGL